jgi:acetoin utilization protein AcuC
MSDRVGVSWDERLVAYDFGPGHPLNPVRVELAMRLSRDLGLLDHVNVEMLSPVLLADIEDVLRVHELEYVQAVQRASVDPHFTDPARGLGTSDTPTFAGMHEASLRVAGASLAGAKAIHSGRVQHAVNLAGGLHHAMPGAAGGFCVYNDVGIAIAWLLAQGVERIAYVDVDVHHGDGVQTIFWDDPRVMTISIHESPETLFPGTGWPADIGGPAALGTAVNVALPAGTGDQGFLRALHALVPDLLEAFDPQVLVTQQGVDSHVEDPLAHLTMSIDGQRMSYEALHRWAHRYADGRWLAVGGGGYALVDVVPRAWAHLIAEATGHRVDPRSAVPESFIEYVRESMGRQAPARMTDGRTPWPKPFADGFNEADPVDQAIAATRAACFPRWGLAVEPVGWF